MPTLAITADTPHLAEFLPPLLASATYLTLYGRRMRTLAREGRPVPTWRAVSFVSGALLLVAVQVGPLDTLGDEVLIAHMIQHIVIGDFCSLLIVLGLTGPVLAPLLHFRVTRPLRVLAQPIVALTLWAVNLYVWHLPLFYQLAIRHDLVHALEHGCLLWFGALLWLALLGPLPKPAWFHGWGSVGYVASVRLIGAVLGNILIWSQTVFYPVYDASDASRGLRPLSDQNLAGAVMMIEQIFLTTLLLGWLFLRFAKQDEERQELLDFAHQRGIELSDERAARAAVAGTTARLRERLLEQEGDPSSRAGDEKADGTADELSREQEEQPTG
jgi:cytochrome c oxidase assembly factor CtaG